MSELELALIYRNFHIYTFAFNLLSELSKFYQFVQSSRAHKTQYENRTR